MSSSWTDYSGPIYSSTAGTGISQVFVNGKMVTEARWPNPVYTNPLRANFATVATGTGEHQHEHRHDHLQQSDRVCQRRLERRQGVDPLGRAFRLGRQLEYVFFQGTNVKQTGNSLTYNWPPPDYPTYTAATFPSYYTRTASNTFFLYGSLAALSAGNQWYSDASTGKLYLQTANGASPAGSTVEVRKRLNGLDMNGQSYINVSGIQFKAANVQVTGNHDVVNNCQILYPTPFTDPQDWFPSTGVTVTGQYNTIKNSEIAYSWGDGVSIRNANNTVNNCLIHDADWAGRRIRGRQRRRPSSAASKPAWPITLVTNCTIYNTGRDGISSVGGATAAWVSNANLQVTHNNVSRFGYLCKDVGGICTSPSNRGGRRRRHCRQRRPRCPLLQRRHQRGHLPRRRQLRQYGPSTTWSTTSNGA